MISHQTKIGQNNSHFESVLFHTSKSIQEACIYSRGYNTIAALSPF